jgi:hypothetical protein
LKLLHGDCLEVLKTLADASVDSVVTDPPAGISFMGKEWDDDRGGRHAWVAWMTDVMRECLRVLKPGAHALVWAIPRTSHWTATALEDAGFEIRDVVTHLFGTGFPKSLDISKSIDKAAGAERPVVGTKHGIVGSVGKTANQLMREGGNDNPNAKSCGAYAPGVKQISGQIPVTAPATPEAQHWQGWGTALKPASEHWILARKPLSEKNVAANVLKWGAGGINVDASRIGTSDNLNGGAYSKGKQSDGTWGTMHDYAGREYTQPTGRFPANLVLSHADACTDEVCEDGCAVRMLDEQAGPLKSGKPSGTRKAKHHFGNTVEQGTALTGYGDSGGASRFFYCAKASKRDRNTGAKNRGE